MNEIRLILLAYLTNALEWLRTRFSKPRVQPYVSPTKYFKKGDLVEAKDGSKGRVWRVYIKIKTGKPVGCSVLWDSSYEGDKITPFLPAEDKSPKFNPIIRQTEILGTK